MWRVQVIVEENIGKAIPHSRFYVGESVDTLHQKIQKFIDDTGWKNVNFVWRLTVPSADFIASGDEVILDDGVLYTVGTDGYLMSSAGERTQHHASSLKFENLVRAGAPPSPPALVCHSFLNTATTLTTTP